MGYRPRLVERLRRGLRARGVPVYLGGVAAFTLAACQVAGAAAAGTGLPAWAAAALALLPASEAAVAVVNALLVAALPPRLLPRLALEDGVPAAWRTLVVVPCLLDHEETVEALVRDLEIRALANPDEGLHFALLSDFADAAEEATPGDEALVALALRRVEALNLRHGGAARLTPCGWGPGSHPSGRAARR